MYTECVYSRLAEDHKLAQNKKKYDTLHRRIPFVAVSLGRQDLRYSNTLNSKFELPHRCSLRNQTTKPKCHQIDYTCGDMHNTAYTRTIVYTDHSFLSVDYFNMIHDSDGHKHLIPEYTLNHFNLAYFIFGEFSLF